MPQSHVNVGKVSNHWKTYVVLWILAVLAVSLATDLGFWGTLFGVAGLTFGFWGLRSLWWGGAASARSVDQVAISSLGGRSEAVELEGRVRPIDEPMDAPLTGNECVAYKVTVKELRPTTAPGGE